MTTVERSGLIEAERPVPVEMAAQALHGQELYETVSASLDELYNVRLLLRPEVVCDPALVVRETAFRDALPTTPLTERYDVGGEAVRVFEKNEAVRGTGSFKEQGAFWAGWQAFQADPRTRVFAAYSAGNHAAGGSKFVNWLNASIDLGFIPRPDYITLAEWRTPATMEAFCKTTASEDKIEKLDAMGANINQKDVFGNDLDSLADARGAAELFVATSDTPAALIPPYAHEHVMAGQANTLLSSLMQLRAAGVDLREKPVVFYAGSGGNGLANGMAVALDKLVELGAVHPESHIVACQMEGCDATQRGLARLDAGETDMTGLFDTEADVPFDGSADGTAVEVPDLGNLRLAQLLRDKGRMRFMTVTKAEVGQDMDRAAVLGVLEEPAAGVAGAGLRKDLKRTLWQTPFEGVAVHVVSGGNCSESTRADFALAAAQNLGRAAVVTAEAKQYGTGKKLTRDGQAFVMSTSVFSGPTQRAWVTPSR